MAFLPLFLPFALFWISLPGSTSSDNTSSHHSHHHSSPLNLLEKGHCKSNIWRTDEMASLPGKCIGINPIHEFDKLKHLKINNWMECRALCCNLNYECVTWQYHNQTNTCYIHPKPFRRGPEGAPTVLYCDPFPTHKWNGKFLKERKNGQCIWEYDLPSQCFAFGPERLNNNGVISMEKGNRMNTKECEEACCNDEKCNSWQEYPGRGCYYGISECKYQEAEGAYEGGRKCLPEFCGNLEKEILLPHQYNELLKLAEKIKNSN